ncbi:MULTISPECIES: hypothetical protein [Streptomyces]|uniref:hypothetical protein n=1 Tax=Streptomyces TaxID=1883 RepID=UPI001042DB0E|nr:hypothetical protein [Streptomyces sp. BK205]TCR23878.1 hypothetical protein EV578_103199 [Streptomyces sp. BK205]
MRATKHAAPQPWRRRGLVTGIPLAPLVVGAPTGRPSESGTGASARATGVHGERPTVDGTAVPSDAVQPEQPTLVRCARR